ncbi:MAG: agmatine deiminase family protein [Bdellovibrionales bacterium]|nr:agmatine deiminase family protein [Bdellovibrionales bacterium]
MTYKMSLWGTIFISTLAFTQANASLPEGKITRRELSPEEAEKLPEYLHRHMNRALSRPRLPLNTVRSIPEWEEAESVITSWPNPALIKAYVQRTKVRILADTDSDRFWWENWLRQNDVPLANITFDIVPTDTIWVQDFGPWWILDGVGNLGIVDPVYNRPRPLDDLIPEYFGKLFNVPVYSLPVVHTGGNFQVDGAGRGFSSTLIYRENPQAEAKRINTLLKETLGVSSYLTAPLGEQTTIEHVDTFAKLVSPDTWVIGDFPKETPHHADAERLLARLLEMKTPFGQQYKIFRLPVTMFKGNLRASINSMIHNKALYFPAYGDAQDELVKQIYQNALPGYEIVPVDAGGTEWSDSIHCRSRNVAKINGFFLFASLKPQTAPDKTATVSAELFPGPDTYISENPKLFYSVNAEPTQVIDMKPMYPRQYFAEIPPQAPGSRVQFYIEAQNSKGARRTFPRYAEHSKVSYVVPATTQGALP